MKKKIFLTVFLLLLIPSILSLNIVRDFSNSSANANEEVVVKLIVSVSPGDEVYVIEENIPAEINIVNPGDGSFNKGKMLWVVMNNLKNTEHTYTVKGIIKGSYEFRGVYSLNGRNETLIEGESILTIKNSAPFCGDGKCDSDESCSICPQDCGECPSSPSSSQPPSGGGSSGGGGSTITSTKNKTSSLINMTSLNKTLESVAEYSTSSKTNLTTSIGKNESLEKPQISEWKNIISKISFFLYFLLLISAIFLIIMIIYFIKRIKTIKDKTKILRPDFWKKS